MAEEKQYTLAELKEKLTEKERLFCHQYIIDWNGARSARVAGYSEDSCRQIAYDTLTKLYIQQYIAFIKNNLEEESGVSKLRNLQELAKIAYSNISHLHDNWIELSDWEVIKEDNPDALSAIESIDTKTELKTFNRGGENKIDVEVKYVKIKLYSKSDAIKTINEMMGYKAADKIEHSGTIQTVNLAQLSTEELLLRANATNKLKEK